MLANAELAQDFTILNQQYRKLISALLDAVSMPGMPVDVDVTQHGNFRGFDGSQFYVVTRGSITARYQGKTVYTPGRGRYPAAGYRRDAEQEVAVFYGSEAGASCTAIRPWISCSGCSVNLRPSSCGPGC